MGYLGLVDAIDANQCGLRQERPQGGWQRVGDVVAVPQLEGERLLLQCCSVPYALDPQVAEVALGHALPE